MEVENLSGKLSFEAHKKKRRVELVKVSGWEEL